jgi:hypothetical protein
VKADCWPDHCAERTHLGPCGWTMEEHRLLIFSENVDHNLIILDHVPDKGARSM